jgi:hypothetical protein
MEDRSRRVGLECLLRALRLPRPFPNSFLSDGTRRGGCCVARGCSSSLSVRARFSCLQRGCVGARLNVVASAATGRASRSCNRQHANTQDLDAALSRIMSLVDEYQQTMATVSATSSQVRAATAWG